jgi:ABC-type protease/lipase transport system fused ATPase/permease subunit
LDSADIYTWDREELGPFVGYLPQDIELFDGTIAENIARFTEIDSEAVVEAAQLAGVHEMILRLPDGYDTQIGSHGGALSGGQRQRIGLARALYGNPCFVVLDEPNSNLDEKGEQELLAALKRMKERGVTVMIIAHRPQVLLSVDKILVLAEGTMKDFGTRDQVMSKFVKPSAAAQAAQAAQSQQGQPKTIQGQAQPANGANVVPVPNR